MKQYQWVELIKLAAAILLAAFLWRQVTDLRKARSFERESANIEPRWVIQMVVTGHETPVQLVEFVFATYDGCQRAALHAKATLELVLMPACVLRWFELGDESQRP